MSLFAQSIQAAHGQLPQHSIFITPINNQLQCSQFIPCKQKQSNTVLQFIKEFQSKNIYDHVEYCKHIFTYLYNNTVVINNNLFICNDFNQVFLLVNQIKSFTSHYLPNQIPEIFQQVLELFQQYIQTQNNQYLEQINCTILETFNDYYLNTEILSFTDSEINTVLTQQQINEIVTQQQVAQTLFYNYNFQMIIQQAIVQHTQESEFNGYVVEQRKYNVINNILNSQVNQEQCINYIEQIMYSEFVLQRQQLEVYFKQSLLVQFQVILNQQEIKINLYQLNYFNQSDILSKYFSQEQNDVQQYQQFEQIVENLGKQFEPQQLFISLSRYIKDNLVQNNNQYYLKTQNIDQLIGQIKNMQIQDDFYKQLVQMDNIQTQTTNQDISQIMQTDFITSVKTCFLFLQTFLVLIQQNQEQDQYFQIEKENDLLVIKLDDFNIVTSDNHNNKFKTNFIKYNFINQLQIYKYFNVDVNEQQIILQQLLDNNINQFSNINIIQQLLVSDNTFSDFLKYTIDNQTLIYNKQTRYDHLLLSQVNTKKLLLLKHGNINNDYLQLIYMVNKITFIDLLTSNKVFNISLITFQEFQLLIQLLNQFEIETIDTEVKQLVNNLQIYTEQKFQEFTSPQYKKFNEQLLFIEMIIELYVAVIQNQTSPDTQQNTCLSYFVISNQLQYQQIIAQNINFGYKYLYLNQEDTQYIQLNDESLLLIIASIQYDWFYDNDSNNLQVKTNLETLEDIINNQLKTLNVLNNNQLNQIIQQNFSQYIEAVSNNNILEQFISFFLFKQNQKHNNKINYQNVSVCLQNSNLISQQDQLHEKYFGNNTEQLLLQTLKEGNIGQFEQNIQQQLIFIYINRFLNSNYDNQLNYINIQLFDAQQLLEQLQHLNIHKENQQPLQLVSDLEQYCQTQNLKTVIGLVMQITQLSLEFLQYNEKNIFFQHFYIVDENTDYSQLINTNYYEQIQNENDIKIVKCHFDFIVGLCKNKFDQIQQKIVQQQYQQISFVDLLQLFQQKIRNNDKLLQLFDSQFLYYLLIQQISDKQHLLLKESKYNFLLPCQLNLHQIQKNNDLLNQLNNSVVQGSITQLQLYYINMNQYFKIQTNKICFSNIYQSIIEIDKVVDQFINLVENDETEQQINEFFIFNQQIEIDNIQQIIRDCNENLNRRIRFFNIEDSVFIRINHKLLLMIQNGYYNDFIQEIAQNTNKFQLNYEQCRQFILDRFQTYQQVMSHNLNYIHDFLVIKEQNVLIIPQNETNNIFVLDLLLTQHVQIHQLVVKYLNQFNHSIIMQLLDLLNQLENKLSTIQIGKTLYYTIIINIQLNINQQIEQIEQIGNWFKQLRTLITNQDIQMYTVIQEDFKIQQLSSEQIYNMFEEKLNIDEQNFIVFNLQMFCQLIRKLFNKNDQLCINENQFMLCQKEQLKQFITQQIQQFIDSNLAYKFNIYALITLFQTNELQIKDFVFSDCLKLSNIQNILESQLLQYTNLLTQQDIKFVTIIRFILSNYNIENKTLNLNITCDEQLIQYKNYEAAFDFYVKLIQQYQLLIKSEALSNLFIVEQKQKVDVEQTLKQVFNTQNSNSIYKQSYRTLIDIVFGNNQTIQKCKQMTSEQFNNYIQLLTSKGFALDSQQQLQIQENKLIFDILYEQIDFSSHIDISEEVLQFNKTYEHVQFNEFFSLQYNNDVIQIFEQNFNVLQKYSKSGKQLNYQILYKIDKQTLLQFLKSFKVIELIQQQYGQEANSIKIEYQERCYTLNLSNFKKLCEEPEFKQQFINTLVFNETFISKMMWKMCQDKQTLNNILQQCDEVL